MEVLEGMAVPRWGLGYLAMPTDLGFQGLPKSGIGEKGFLKKILQEESRAQTPQVSLDNESHGFDQIPNSKCRFPDIEKGLINSLILNVGCCLRYRRIHNLMSEIQI